MQYLFDYFGNPVAFFTILEPHKKLEITAKHRIEVTACEPIPLHETPSWEAAAESLASDRSRETLDARPTVSIRNTFNAAMTSRLMRRHRSRRIGRSATRRWI